MTASTHSTARGQEHRENEQDVTHRGVLRPFWRGSLATCAGSSSAIGKRIGNPQVVGPRCVAAPPKPPTTKDLEGVTSQLIRLRWYHPRERNRVHQLV